MKMKRIIMVAGLCFGTIVLGSCQAKRADKTFDVCFDSLSGTGEAIAMLRRVSSQFGYRFREYGAEAKADLKTIDANPSVIPDGRPIQADIKRNDGKILLMASNFGSKRKDIRVSFFFYGSEGENSPFYRTVMSGVERLPNVRLYPNDAEADANLCGRDE